MDEFNVLITVEAALSCGVLIRARDGVLRDLASVHGNWRRIEETERALDLLCASAPRGTWFFDSPVSNSGRAAAMVRARGVSAEVVPTADEACFHSELAVATGDGPLIDRAGWWVDIVSPIVTELPDVWMLDLARV